MIDKIMETPEAFLHRVNTELDAIGRRHLRVMAEISKEDQDLYQFLENYAKEKQLFRTSIALPLVRGLLNGEFYGEVVLKHGIDFLPGYYHHCLAIARMVVDLDVLEDKDETDIAMAAGLCHVLPENSLRLDDSEDMLTEHRMPQEVYRIVRLITRKDPLPPDKERLFYLRIQEDKLALLIRMIDRGNLVETLHENSMSDSMKYIKETKQYFFPMCIYARDHYPELSKAAGLLLSKTKQLIDVAEILVTRYQQREMELMTRILDLKEENSRYRVMIQQAEDN